MICCSKCYNTFNDNIMTQVMANLYLCPTCFSTKTISTEMSGHSVYCGDYENEDIIIIANETEVIDWLKSEIE